MEEKLKKIQKLRNRLDDLQAKDPVRSVERLLDEEQQKARDSASSPNGTALKVLARGVANAQNDPRPKQLADDLAKSKEENASSIEELSNSFKEQVESLMEEVKSSEAKGKKLTTTQVTSLFDRLTEYEETFSAGMESLKGKDSDLEGEIARVSEEIPKLYERLDSLPDLSPSIRGNSESIIRVKDSTEEIRKLLEELDKRLTNRINSFNNHGGNMNRSILVGGDKDTLSKFSDINLKAGAGTTITYQANQTTQYTDITITATGGGAGITRSVNVVSTDTAAGSTDSVDYVYVVSGTTTLTLPTAVGNSNLYTMKNVGTGVVSIATTGGQTIDGSVSPLQLPLQYTSVDLISNGSNWDIT